MTPYYANQNIFTVHSLVTSLCSAECMPVEVSHAALLYIGYLSCVQKLLESCGCVNCKQLMWLCNKSFRRLTNLVQTTA